MNTPIGRCLCNYVCECTYICRLKIGMIDMSSHINQVTLYREGFTLQQMNLVWLLMLKAGTYVFIRRMTLKECQPHNNKALFSLLWLKVKLQNSPADYIRTSCITRFILFLHNQHSNYICETNSFSWSVIMTFEPIFHGWSGAFIHT